MQRADVLSDSLEIEGNMMAKPASNQEPVVQDMGMHRRDYAGFVNLFTYGAIICFVIGIAVLFIIS